MAHVLGDGLSIRVMIVDDSAAMRHLLSSVVSASSDMELVAAAPNGRVALERIPRAAPDVLTLDIEMPVMDGLETLTHLARQYPQLPVIMFSSLTREGASSTMIALANGATDYLCKPVGMGRADAQKYVEHELLSKIRAVTGRSRPKMARPRSRRAEVFKESTDPFELLVVGSSTGGPNALAVFAGGLGVPKVPILFVQHMPPLFTKMLADRLNKKASFPIREAVDGDLLEAGVGLVAPGGKHMLVRRGRSGSWVELNEDPPEHSCRPAVDPLFRSAASSAQGRVMGVVLTGMGADGAAGSRAIRKQGGYIIAQDEATSVVWGMPGAVATANLAHDVLPIQRIAARVVNVLSAKPTKAESTRVAAKSIEKLRASAAALKAIRKEADAKKTTRRGEQTRKVPAPTATLRRNHNDETRPVRTGAIPARKPAQRRAEIRASRNPRPPATQSTGVSRPATGLTAAGKGRHRARRGNLVDSTLVMPVTKASRPILPVVTRGAKARTERRAVVGVPAVVQSKKKGGNSLSAADLDYVCQIVRWASAIELDQSKEYLVESRLSPVARAKGYPSISALVADVRSPGAKQAALQAAIVDAMTTNETSFFRDSHPFEVLESEVFPRLIKERASTRTINILCAACSSGQEPYSIAMILDSQFGHKLDGWRVQIRGVDLSPTMVERARGGYYSSFEIARGLPAPLRRRYFKSDGDGNYQVDRRLRAMVSFEEMNLIEPWPKMQAMDLVFMRNVLIYFSNETKLSLLEKARKQLCPDGYLILGSSETLLGLTDNFERVSFGRSTFFARLK